MTVIGFVVAAAVGGVARWQSTRLNQPGLPVGTFVVNVVAAFAAGLAVDVSTTAALIVTTALLGSLSTFSTLTGELFDLRESHGPLRSTAYAAATLVGGVGAASFALAL